MNNISSGAIRCKYLTSYLIAVIMNEFVQLLLVKVATWKIWPWHLNPRYTVQQSQLSHTNINLYKSNNWAFSQDLTVFQILYIYIYIYILPEFLWPWKCKSRWRYTTFCNHAIWWPLWISIKVVPEHFFARFHRVPDIAYLAISRNSVTLKI